MPAASDIRVILIKAEENLASAQSELANGRDNACANRAFYACFQAAVAALMEAGIPRQGDEWSHGYVQSQFAGQFITRRKLYPLSMRDVLPQLATLRIIADYRFVLVSQRNARRAVEHASLFVGTIQARLKGTSRK
ncbi:MAG TPA: HEPN domain-containing protein [Thermomicrobiales bacterium]|nr:HEPN domain-containing protein [Thermomicrobiales bacterium]